MRMQRTDPGARRRGRRVDDSCASVPEPEEKGGRLEAEYHHMVDDLDSEPPAGALRVIAGI
jgi:hypothetical protein